MPEHPSEAAMRILACPITQEKDEGTCICQDGDTAKVARAYLDLLASVGAEE